MTFVCVLLSPLFYPYFQHALKSKLLLDLRYLYMKLSYDSSLQTVIIRRE